jgi:hypothetical protein
MVPDLGRIDAMPVRTLAARQQEVDRGRGGASACDRVAECFTEMPAFGMRLEREHADHVGSGKRLHGGSKVIRAFRVRSDCFSHVLVAASAIGCLFVIRSSKPGRYAQRNP